MRVCILTLFLIFLCSSLSAQKEVPGYLGSKFRIEVEGTGFIARPKVVAGGQLGYTVSRRTELFGGYSAGSHSRDRFYRSSSYRDDDIDRIYEIVHKDRSFKYNRIVVGMNISLGQQLSPIGKHLRIGLMKYTVQPGEVDLVTIDSFQNEVISRESHANKFALNGIEIGYYDRNILSGNFFMAYGISLNYVANNRYNGRFYASGLKNGVTESKQAFLDNRVARDLGFDVVVGQVFAIELGVGIVL